MKDLKSLLVDIRRCKECESHLPLGPRPILAADLQSKVLIVGQAPGVRVHESGVPWDDPSGQRLREWTGISHDDFYDETKVALVPMGFCYPGTGKGGDLPPRKECAQLWHEQLLSHLQNVKLTLVIGSYAQQYHFGKRNKRNLTETVKAWKDFAPAAIPMPHPSPRNNRWLKKNPWFGEEVLPYLKRRTKQLL